MPLAYNRETRKTSANGVNQQIIERIFIKRLDTKLFH